MTVRHFLTRQFLTRTKSHPTFSHQDKFRLYSHFVTYSSGYIYSHFVAYPPTTPDNVIVVVHAFFYKKALYKKLRSTIIKTLRNI